MNPDNPQITPERAAIEIGLTNHVEQYFQTFGLTLGSICVGSVETFTEPGEPPAYIVNVLLEDSATGSLMDQAILVEADNFGGETPLDPPVFEALAEMAAEFEALDV